MHAAIWQKWLGEVATCSGVTMTSPVVEMWVQTDDLVARAAVGRLALVGDTKITREDLITNEQIIIPILKHCGLRTTVDQILEHVELFMAYARPKGKPDLPRTLS